jgi:TolB-like protein
MRNGLFHSLVGSVILVAASASLAAPAEMRVVVLPFSTSATQDGGSIGVGIQSSLLADLPHASAGSVESNLDPTKDVVALAQARHATYVVAGQVQRVDSSLRITAQLLDANGQTVGSAKESGDVHDLFQLEDKLAFDLRDSIRSVERSHHALQPMPTIASAGPIRFAPQPLLPVGTVPVTYTSQKLRDGQQRNIYNYPFYECDGFGCAGFGFGGCGFGFVGFCFGPPTVGFATGGTGQGAY